jgi:release factor glutamine methyltransferase
LSNQLNTADTASPTTRIDDALRRAAVTLRRRSESARLDAEILLAKVLGSTRAGLLAHGTQWLSESDAAAFDALIARRLRGTPVAYLTESREFWSLNLRVSPAVLIPRPETEILVEQALKIVPKAPPRSLLDLGTGSGAIALAIASERPDWNVTATDMSGAALAVAQHNARDLPIAPIRWQLGSWFDAVPGERFDLIVSNPPYVAAGDPALIDLSDEPPQALTPGPTGLEALCLIIAQAPAHLLAAGSLLLEHGQDQASAVQQLLQAHGFDAIRTCLDLAGKSRVTLGTLHTTAGNL